MCPLPCANGRAERARPALSIEKFQRELEGIQQFEALRPQQGSRGHLQVATVLSNCDAAQKALTEALDLDCLLEKGWAMQRVDRQLANYQRFMSASRRISGSCTLPLAGAARARPRL